MVIIQFRRISIGGYFGGHQNYITEITGELKAYTKLCEEEPLSLWDDDNQETCTKDTFIDELKDFHIGEWRRRYSTKRFGNTVCDATQWEL